MTCQRLRKLTPLPTTILRLMIFRFYMVGNLASAREKMATLAKDN